MLESLVRSGFAVEALSGTTVGTGEDLDPAAYLSARGIAHEQVGGGAWQADAKGVLRREHQALPGLSSGVFLDALWGHRNQAEYARRRLVRGIPAALRRSAEQVPSGYPRELWRRPAGPRDQITGLSGPAAVFAAQL